MTRHALGVRPGSVTTDLEQMATLTRRPRGQTGPEHIACPACLGRLQSAVQLYRGEFCAGVDIAHSPQADDWLFQMRETWRHHVVATVHDLWEVAAACDDDEAALAAARRLVELEPWSEHGHERMMRSLARLDRAAAAKHYRHFRELLGRELDIEPSEALTAIYRQIVNAPGVLDSPVEPVAKDVTAASGRPRRQRTGFDWADRPGGLFVGRDRELHLLSQAAARSREGRGVLVLVRGEAGIGKTRLLCEFVGELAEGQAPLLVRTTACLENDDLPYAAVARLLAPDLEPDRMTESGSPAPERKPEAAVGDDPAVRTAFTDKGFDVDRLDRLVELVMGGAVAEARGGPLSAAGKRAAVGRPAVFDAVARHVVRGAARTPLVLVLEDLHWAPPSTVALIRHVVQAAESSRILVLLSYRENDLDASARLALAELRRGPDVVDVSVTGLEVEPVARLGAYLGVAHPAGTAREVHARTAGNPFFVHELLRAARFPDDQPRSAEGEPSVPAAIRDIVAARVARLPEETQRSLVVAAVAGPDFDLDLVAAVRRMDPGTVLTTLEPAERAALIAPTSLPGHWAFAHDLLRDAQLASLTVSARTRLHAKIAAALVERQRCGRHIAGADLVRHLLAAGPLVPANTVFEVCFRAGHQAGRALAFEEAVTFYGHALDALSRSAGEDDTQRCELLVAMGETMRRGGDAGHRAVLLDAAGLAQRIGHPELMADAIVAVAPGGWATRFGRPDPALADLARRALSRLPAADLRRRATLTALLAADVSLGPDHRQAAGISAEAVEMARRSGDPATLVFVLLRHYWAAYDPLDLPARRAVLDEAVALAGEIDDLEAEVYARSCRVNDAMAVADLDAALSDVEIIEEKAPWLGQAFYTWLGLEKRSGLALLRGDLHGAEALSVEAALAGTGSPSAAPVATRAAQRCLIAIESGRVEDLLDEATAAADAMPAFRAWTAVVAALHCHAGRLDEAAALLEDLTAHDFEDLPRNLSWVSALVCASTVAVALGDRERASLIRERLLPCSGRLDWFGGGSFGPVDLALGRLDLLLGDEAEGERHLRNAVGLCRRVGAHGFLALSRATLAGVHAS